MIITQEAGLRLRGSADEEGRGGGWEEGVGREGEQGGQGDGPSVFK